MVHPPLQNFSDIASGREQANINSAEQQSPSSSEDSATPGKQFGDQEESPRFPLAERTSTPSLFPISEGYWSHLQYIEWTLPTEGEVEGVQMDNSHYTSNLMDTFGKVFQDNYLQSAWTALTPSDDIGPPLFLSTQDLRDLQQDFSTTKSPSDILRRSDISLRSPQVMEKVCKTVESSDPKVDTKGQFRHKPSYFLFPLELQQQIQEPGGTETEMTTRERPYWATVKILPLQLYLGVFVRREDQESFRRNAKANLDLINCKSGIICEYWDYEPHSYSLNEVDFINNPIRTIKCSSGPANATFVYSAISGQIPHIPVLKTQNVLDGLYEVLSSACGYRKVYGGQVKRRATESLSDETRGTKRRRVTRSF
jgi:hypothetical protein